jgi:DNA-directed RNA polymerase subunit RPC12/RpoP
MQYICYKCGKIISDDINKRFIAEDGVCLCEKCSVGVAPCSERIRKILIDLEEKEK